MKAESKILTGLFVIQWLDFPTGNRPYGGGGWSRNARHRPLSQPYQQVVEKIESKGKSFIVNGTRRLKLNIYDAIAMKWLRSDYYDLREQFEFHARLNKDTTTGLRSLVGQKPIALGEPRAITLED